MCAFCSLLAWILHHTMSVSSSIKTSTGWMFRRNFHGKLNLQIRMSAEISYAWKCVWPSIFSLYSAVVSGSLMQSRKKSLVLGLSNNVFLDWLTISSFQLFEPYEMERMHSANAVPLQRQPSLIRTVRLLDVMRWDVKRENDKRCTRHSNHNRAYFNR